MEYISTILLLNKINELCNQLNDRNNNLSEIERRSLIQRIVEIDEILTAYCKGSS